VATVGLITVIYSLFTGATTLRRYTTQTYYTTQCSVVSLCSVARSSCARRASSSSQLHRVK